MEPNMPMFVCRNGMASDKNYVEWLSEIKSRFRSSQLKAAIRVNTDMLELYWSIGRDLVRMKAEERWGSGIVKQFALDMRNAFPTATGFSDTNIKYMKRWYLFYYELVAKGQWPVDQLGNQNEAQIVSFEKGQRVVDFLEMPKEFGQIPWGQHIDIFSKCKNLDEALFYIAKTIENSWSRPQLLANIENNLFKKLGAAVSNFNKTLPTPQGKLAQEILKDPYNFDFLSMSQDYEEKDLEDALVRNVTQFLLELGKGFSYVGRQMELQMPGGQTFFPDLVFYHIPQHRYVVIELKAVKYMPEFAGKLNFYVTAVDELLRGENDNPSVGLVICKSTDKTIVEWSLKDINKPLGVATYQLQEVVDRTVAELEKQNKNSAYADPD